MLLEYLSASFLYSLLKDIKGRFSSKPSFSPMQMLEQRAKWKKPFEECIFNNFRNELREDVIIRGINRLTQYPDIDEKLKGISPWFRVGLIDTYHNGILIALQYQSLIEKSDGNFRIKKIDEINSDCINCVLAGKIPYHMIENVDFDGDEFYNYPHLFCHFGIKRLPYESVDYYLRKQIDNFPYFYVALVPASKVENPYRKKRFNGR